MMNEPQSFNSFTGTNHQGTGEKNVETQYNLKKSSSVQPSRWKTSERQKSLMGYSPGKVTEVPGSFPSDSLALQKTLSVPKTVAMSGRPRPTRQSADLPPRIGTKDLNHDYDSNECEMRIVRHGPLDPKDGSIRSIPEGNELCFTGDSLQDSFSNLDMVSSGVTSSSDYLKNSSSSSLSIRQILSRNSGSELSSAVMIDGDALEVTYEQSSLHSSFLSNPSIQSTRLVDPSNHGTSCSVEDSEEDSWDDEEIRITSLASDADLIAAVAATTSGACTVRWTPIPIGQRQESKTSTQIMMAKFNKVQSHKRTYSCYVPVMIVSLIAFFGMMIFVYIHSGNHVII